MTRITQTIGRSWLQRPSAVLFLLVSYLIWAAVALRWITIFSAQNQEQLGLVTGLLLLYAVLLGLEPLITRAATRRAHLYLATQTLIVLGSSFLYYELDFFALLYLPLCGQAMLLFPRRTAVGWLVVLIAATIVGQIYQFGWPEALSFTLLYLAGLVFVAAFSIITLQAEAAQRRGAELLAQLQEAHEQLQLYADQAEKLAIANERNRLARDLHDSVAQTLYGLTLQFETARRKLGSNQLTAVEEDLHDMQRSTQQTLQETRLLIFELRPPILEEEGLAAAINNRLELVEARSGLRVHKQIQAVGRLAPETELALYRISQEALNNIIKHAQASEITVALGQHDHKRTLQIRDDGLGFDPQQIDKHGGLGLKGMHERAARIDAQLRITSTPGQGTEIFVEVS